MGWVVGRRRVHAPRTAIATKFLSSHQHWWQVPENHPHNFAKTQLKIEPPERSQIERLVRSVIKRHEKQLFDDLTLMIPKRVRKRLDELIEFDEDDDETNSQKINFTQLRKGPGGSSLKSILREIDKVERLRDIGIPENLFEKVSPNLVHLYKQRAATERLHELRRHPDYVKYPLLAAFCHVRLQETTDNLIELLMKVVHNITKRAQKSVINEFVADLQRVEGKPNILYRMAEAALSNPDGTVRDVIFPVVGEQTLRDLVKEFKQSGPYYEKKVSEAATNSYSRYWRRMVPRVLDALDLKSNNQQHQPVIKAFAVLRKKGKFTKKDVNQLPIDDLVKASDKHLIFKNEPDGKQEVDTMALELCLWDALSTAVKSKEIWDPKAGKYQNPDKDIPADFDEKRHEYYKALKLPIRPQTFIHHLQLEMKSHLAELNDTILTNPKVRFDKAGQIIITPLKAQPPPPNLEALGEALEQRWGLLSTLDMLKETDLRVDFTRCFKSVATREVLDRKTIQRRLLLCFHALATNTGLKRGSAGESTDNLKYILRRFVLCSAMICQV